MSIFILNTVEKCSNRLTSHLLLKKQIWSSGTNPGLWNSYSLKTQVCIVFEPKHNSVTGIDKVSATKYEVKINFPDELKINKNKLLRIYWLFSVVSWKVNTYSKNIIHKKKIIWAMYKTTAFKDQQQNVRKKAPSGMDNWQYFFNCSTNILNYCKT